MGRGPDVFISYRTADGGIAAAHLAGRLAEVVGPDQVFRDSDTLLPGAPWPDALTSALDEARVLVAVIGPAWAGTGRPGSRRIDDPGDWVRREILHALRRDVPVVPVVLDGASGPAELGLDGELAGLEDVQTAPLRHRDLTGDTGALIDRLLRLVPELAVHRVFEAPPVRPAELSPSALLRPEFGIVPFAGRDEELTDLDGWLDSVAGEPVRLRTGRGGVGKTRLALRLVSCAHERGWPAGLLAEDADPALLATLRVPTLVVVDYAEGRSDQVGALLAATATAPLRVLLLARTAGRWRQRLARHRDEHVAALAESLVGTPLAPLAPNDPVAEFERALDAFIDHLPGARRPRSPSRLDVVHALDVHAAALAELLDRTHPATSSVDPVRRVLAHERRFWASVARPHGLDPEPDDHLAVVVTCATLTAAPPDADAGSLVADALRTADPVPYLRWHAEAYPDAPPFSSLRPDRLGEELVSDTLADHPDLPDRIATSFGTRDVTRALTVLSRAAGRHPHLERALTAMMRADPTTNVPLAIAVSTGDLLDDDTLGRVLSGLVGEDAGPDVLDQLPDRSSALAGLAVVATRASLRREENSSHPDPVTRARLTHDLAVRLNHIGESEHALAEAVAAVDLYRTLREPTATAMALDTLATVLYALGQHHDALDRVEQGLALLPADAPSHHRATLMATRGNLLGNVHRPGEAVAALEAALEAARVSTDPEVEELDQRAAILTNLAVAHLDLAHLDDAHLDAALEAASASEALRAELADEQPDRYREDHIQALVNLGAVYAERREHAKAAALADGAIVLARGLVGRYGDRHLDALADALNNSATALRRTGDPEAAIIRLTEAVLVYRDLADARPAVSLSSLAAALHNLGSALDDVGRVSAALDRYDEAVDIFRKIAGPGPEGSDAVELAETLRARVGPRLAMKDVAGAVEDAEEAVELMRRHADGRGRARRQMLAGALHELAKATSDPEPAEEAVAILRELADGSPDGDHDLNVALHGLAQHLDEAGEHAVAAPLFAEVRRRVTGDPDLLSTVLHDEALCRSELGEHVVALELITEAVALRRQRADATALGRLELAESLNNLADTMRDVGRDAEAVAVATEAVEVAGALADDLPGGARLHVFCLLTLAGVLDEPTRTEVLHRAETAAGGDEELEEMVRESS
ncbi:toll/interleukin-1 receptor domain-containing protein [Actinomycetospora aeridis]|uniref:Toll/interleukin-1 receptor domain-containing protein n=1 Tax=Actinomycetospora aeridis TaxID=3129231 RepID=A0ABU8NAE8_9PSEU